MPDHEADASLARSLARIEQIGGVAVASWLQPLLTAQIEPSRASHRLESWLQASSSPATYLQAMAQSPATTQILLKVLTSSHQLSDLLAQNPQLASLVLDGEGLLEAQPVAQLITEGRRLLSQSTSYAHRLDRLRYLKQRETLLLASRDLAALWPAEKIWRGLSDVADALLILAAEVVWEEVAGRDGTTNPCPVQIVAMGKHGGQELNYSSDVDLVFILDAEVQEDEEKRATKYAEMFVAALSTKMGRGALYRVDVRLRPFGSQGPLVSRSSSVESYYNKYAEPWEQLALIRSRPVTGSDETGVWWEKLRRQHAFRPSRGEWAIDSLVALRTRLEGINGPNDLKRGVGGIRDIEFLIQMIQLTSGFVHPELQGRTTIPMIKVAARLGLIPSEAETCLTQAYTLYRQTEHRLQIEGDLQTHTLPVIAGQRTELARLLDFETLATFEVALGQARQNVRRWYLALTPQQFRETPEIKMPSTAVQKWIVALPDSNRYLAALAENEASLERLEFVAKQAPALLSDLSQSPGITELIMSAEIDVPATSSARRKRFAKKTGVDLAMLIRHGRLGCVLHSLSAPAIQAGRELSDFYDDALLALSQRVAPNLHVMTCGSYASQELSLRSDLDLVLFSDPFTPREQAEAEGQRFISELDQLRKAGAPLEYDLRLRPEGRQGAVVTSVESFDNYASTRLEAWEKLALRRIRPLTTAAPIQVSLHRVLFEQKWTEAESIELVKMKRRVERERVSATLKDRHLKFCPGGMDDIVWIVQLWMGKETPSFAPGPTPDCIKNLASLGVWNQLEHDLLLDAFLFWTELRRRVALHGFPDDLMPENPDKLDVLAEGTGLGDGNELLAVSAEHRRVARGIYEESLERFLKF